jgi:hypothetical protein
MSARGALLCVEMAIRGNRLVSATVGSWRQGSSVWELPLLNQLTGRLAQKRRDVRVGYIRTSKKDQNPELQRRELLAFGCERIFEEQISSREADRSELRAAMDYCRPRR